LEALAKKMKRFYAMWKNNKVTFKRRSRCRQLISNCMRHGSDGIPIIYSPPYDVEVNCANKHISEVKGFKIWMSSDPNKWTGANVNEDRWKCLVDAGWVAKKWTALVGSEVIKHADEVCFGGPPPEIDDHDFCCGNTPCRKIPLNKPEDPAVDCSRVTCKRDKIFKDLSKNATGIHGSEYTKDKHGKTKTFRIGTDAYGKVDALKKYPDCTDSSFSQQLKECPKVGANQREFKCETTLDGISCSCSEKRRADGKQLEGKC